MQCTPQTLLRGALTVDLDLQRRMAVRLAVTAGRESGAASAEFQLGDEYRFYPCNAALAAWRAQAEQFSASIVYG